ncbi:unnamed protein product [Rotaria socialis]|uniref:Uncharacterized protein n=1 Tax=Rotaria socialis TaxID=392032 RepID=A0A819YF12_9BILA|nr:unnamed protein product [Rotaria socialis]CAF3329160.1 unnamed protein product [Rotaria socialis]CAF3363125.1 unnamed protein product [Rotaria socialis]CAF3509454.1 unnamed protein product [Rotaria socialis]CAF4155767.1 unnamed protein product [Rotaria socialis]
MDELDVYTKQCYKRCKNMKKSRRTKVDPKSITITAERLSDHSHITFTISSDKTIEQLRALLNYHLPPLLPNKFDLYSCQRGALIHFHPCSFKLDYFPVIFDHSILLLKMDDRLVDENNKNSPQHDKNELRRNSRRSKYLILNNIFSSKTTAKTRRSSTVRSTSSSTVTCLSLLKQIFHQSPSNSINTISEINIVTY